MARINLRDEGWLEIRFLAMTQKRSGADYLELVRGELDERKRLESVAERPNDRKEDSAASYPVRSRFRLSEARFQQVTSRAEGTGRHEPPHASSSATNRPSTPIIGEACSRTITIIKADYQTLAKPGEQPIVCLG